MSINTKERRSHKRHKVTLSINYRVAKNIFSITTQSRDMSLGGISFFVQQRLSRGVLLELNISFPGEIECFEMPASVTWRSDSTNIKFPFVIGVKFDNLKDSQHAIINSYLKQHPN